MCFGSTTVKPAAPPPPPPPPPVEMAEEVKTKKPKRRKPGQSFALRIPRPRGMNTGQGGGSGLNY